MEKFCVIGVDVSKKKLDFCVMVQGKVTVEQVVANHPQSIRSVLKQLQQEFGVEGTELLICAEHTGQYTYPLACACQALECTLWLENPAQIKYSSGVQRGKNDKVDAKRIALYATRFGDKFRTYSRPTAEIEELKQLTAERSLYVTDLGKYKAQLKDQREFMPEKLYKEKSKRFEGVIEALEEELEAVDQKIEMIIDSTEVLRHQMELLTSVEGVGRVVATAMIITTEAFTRFDDCRKFNCYAGLAPFSYTSGSSQHSKNRVSNRADKSIKSLLHMAALSVVSKKTSELKDYFLRKVEEGKSKMTVINAIRAKIVARMFAVIRKKKPYTAILS